MEKFAELIAVLLEHSQRFFEIWNLQLIVVLGVLGFVLANQNIVSKTRVRVLLSAVFIAIAVYSVYSLSAHQNREEKLWTAIEARVAAAPGEFIPQEVAYIDSLKPTPFPVKSGALVVADILVVLVIWFSPKLKE
jgi:hypothetical protein